MERTSAAGIVSHDLSAAVEQILVGHKTFQSDGAAGVKFAGADTDFCAESVAETVREASGAVAVDTG